MLERVVIGRTCARCPIHISISRADEPSCRVFIKRDYQGLWPYADRQTHRGIRRPQKEPISSMGQTRSGQGRAFGVQIDPVYETRPRRHRDRLAVCLDCNFEP
ncbi:hypothetical protein B0H63DRAFT_490434 [Podospora didyma]|uniref:Uncharacterized protein n=1 Tax=Podospora didyma TaxID=330526 RepID=A0AAE0JY16_9PEZI|nr:hypothetical protein B0H63DRAFT_490434 [Podospora didyma]